VAGGPNVISGLPHIMQTRLVISAMLNFEHSFLKEKIFRLVPFRVVPFRAVPFRAVPFRVVPFREVLFSVVPFRVVPFRLVPFRVVPFKLYNNWDSLKMTKMAVILNHGNIATYLLHGAESFLRS